MGESAVFVHYSSEKPLYGEIIRGRMGEFITAKLPNTDVSLFRRGDPLVIGQLDPYEETGVKCFGGNIVDTNKSQHIVLISPDKSFHDPERRQYTRHKVSLTGYIRSNVNKKEEICIKDISYSGVGLYSEKEIDVNSTVTIDMLLGGMLFTSDGTIIRKSTIYGRKEYGVQLLHRDKQSIYYTQHCFDTYLESEINKLKRILEMKEYGL